MCACCHKCHVGDVAKDTECMIMGINQHLVCLDEGCPKDERAALAQLRIGHLQFSAFMADDCPVFRPVELKGFTRIKGQRNVCPISRGLQFSLKIGLLKQLKRHAYTTHHGEGSAHATASWSASACGSSSFPSSGRPLINQRKVQAYRPLGNFELRFYTLQTKISAHGIPRQTGPATDLPDR